MRIININNKYDYIEENSLFKKKGGESLLQKLHIQLLPQLVCAGRGVQCRRGGWGARCCRRWQQLQQLRTESSSSTCVTGCCGAPLLSPIRMMPHPSTPGGVGRRCT